MWNFGCLLRAARMGYHPLPGRREGLLRITDVPGGWLCELRPLGLVPNDHRTGEEHRCWWEPDGGIELVESSSSLRSVKRVKEYMSVVLDDQGRLVQTGG